jgi:hypothetical protein
MVQLPLSCLSGGGLVQSVVKSRGHGLVFGHGFFHLDKGHFDACDLAVHAAVGRLYLRFKASLFIRICARAVENNPPASSEIRETNADVRREAPVAS